MPRAVALNCGVYDISREERIAGSDTPALLEDLLGTENRETKRAMLNPLPYITEQYPPVFVMTAEGDFLKEQAPLLVRVLMEKEVPFLYRYYRNPKKKLGHVFHCNIRTADAALCNEEECSFFRELCQK